MWTRAYWRDYLGRLGDVGWRVQRRCIRVRQQALCPSELHARRLRDGGARGPVIVYRGLYAGTADVAPLEAEPCRGLRRAPHPREARDRRGSGRCVARESFPELRGEILGDGPDRPEVLRQIAEAGLGGVVEAPGFVTQERMEQSLARALCLLLPSGREGYGLIVVEAAARGVPSIVVAGSDNAATELVEEGVNGFVVPSAAPDDLAAAIIRVRDAGPALRDSTRRWYDAHAAELSVASTVEIVSGLGGPRSSQA